MTDSDFLHFKQNGFPFSSMKKNVSVHSFWKALPSSAIFLFLLEDIKV